MGSRFEPSDGIRINKIDNGYILRWAEEHDADDNCRGCIATHEYYAQSLEDALQRMKTLFQGQ
jgi:hypothetical protein